jgi:magnesium-transporting ATPase (P-type)
MPVRGCAWWLRPGNPPATGNELDHPDLQDGVILLGIAGMMDPPRPEAITAIADCLQAGIRVKMITGDHPQTAMSIGQMLGIGNAASAITGRELEAMDDRQLSDAAQQYDIFAEPARRINSALCRPCKVNRKWWA